MPGNQGPWSINPLVRIMGVKVLLIIHDEELLLALRAISDQMSIVFYQIIYKRFAVN